MKPALLLILVVAAIPVRSAPMAERPLVQRIELPAENPAAPQVTVVIPHYRLTPQEREIIATCLILEAASQGDFGMRGVMSVIRNRARSLPELYAPTVLRPKQFSALNRVTVGRTRLSELVERARRDRMWPVALQIVDDACRDSWHDATHGATHYTRASENIYWTRGLARTVIIGAHAFYR